MDAYALHLAMAALVGASFVAVSAYYVHRKTLTQLLEFARAVERERDRDRRDGDESCDDRKKNQGKRSLEKKKGAGHTRSGLAPLPDVMTAAEADREEEEEEVDRFPVNGQLADLGTIPPGLPRLQTVVEGNYVLDRFLSELVIQ